MAIINKTAWVDAGHIIDIVQAQRIGTVTCVRSLEVEDLDSGEILSYTPGVSCVAADSDVVREFPDYFASDDSPEVSLPPDSPPAPDVRGLLVCIHAFEYPDLQTGEPRFMRYGWDFTTPDSWLAEHYGEFFIPVEAVVPSDRIPHLPLRDEEGDGDYGQG